MKAKKRVAAVESKGEEESKGTSTVAAVLIVVCAGLACVVMLQRILEKKTYTAYAQRDAQFGGSKMPARHLQLKDASEQKVFIGFKYADRLYFDASALCVQPGFRMRADEDGLIKVPRQIDAELLMETPDIAMPGKLAHESWSAVSAGSPPEGRVFDTTYQWFSYADAPHSNACLFLGKRAEDKTPQEFSTERSEPVLGIRGLEAPKDLRLHRHEGAVEVTEENRPAMLLEFPWLLAWLNEFGIDSPDRCGSPDGITPVTLLLPMKVEIFPGSQQSTHWMAATGCDTLDKWSLVMTNEDGTTSFITLDRPSITYDYWPTKVWTADTNSDGVPEFLIKGQYYEGDRYVLLRLIKDGRGSYRLSEIASTAYDGL